MIETNMLLAIKHMMLERKILSLKTLINHVVTSQTSRAVNLQAPHLLVQNLNFVVYTTQLLKIA